MLYQDTGELRVQLALRSFEHDAKGALRTIPARSSAHYRAQNVVMADWNKPRHKCVRRCRLSDGRLSYPMEEDRIAHAR